MKFSISGVRVRLYLIILFFCIGCAKFLPSPDNTNMSTQEFRIFHYNIKELDSYKLMQQPHPQMSAVIQILKNQKFDILSINEIQYDLPGVPDFNYQSQGENLTRFARLIGLDPSNWAQVFSPANTGTMAKRNANSEYFINDSEIARKHADPINYGLFPAQYSTAGLIKNKVKDKVIINKLLWRDFNPKQNIMAFATEDGRNLPEDMVLFDKNFNHAVTTIHGKEVHVIFLHTVPSYHFGNKRSPNYERNADQLKFLEWYVTGETDFSVSLDRSQWPLIKKDDAVIIVGDLNADVNQKDNPGGAVLRRLMKKFNPWLKDPGATNESSNFSPNPFSLLLDYILISDSLKVVDAGVIRPEANAIELGCNEAKAASVKSNLRRGRVLVEYIDSKTKLTCYRTVSQEYYTAKIASDHFPIYATLKFK